MDLNRLTQKSQEAVSAAQQRAIERGHQDVDVEHLLLALVEQEDGLVARLCERMDVPREPLARAVEQELRGRPSVSGPGYEPGKVVLSGRLARLLLDAEKHAKRMQDEYVSVEHLMLAILGEGAGQPAGKVLSGFQITPDRFLHALKEVRGNQRVQSANPEQTYEALERYGRDLVALARQDKLDPVIGRDEEIRRVIQVLSAARTKNNPILIGEPGVGKTAIVEGLAAAYRVTVTCPKVSRTRRLISLDLSSMVAGAKYRGEFEERLKAVLDGDPRRPKAASSLLFIDEMHTIVGAGKPPKARWTLRQHAEADAGTRRVADCMGATTLDEYRQHIEKDKALERRFQTVLVTEPTVEDSISILRGLRERFEVHHGVHIQDAALVAAATLSHRYITDRFLPDKAIDLVDEACALIRTEIDSMPAELDAATRRVMQLEIEEAALAKEKDKGSKERRLEGCCAVSSPDAPHRSGTPCRCPLRRAKRRKSPRCARTCASSHRRRRAARSRRRRTRRTTWRPRRRAQARPACPESGEAS